MKVKNEDNKSKGIAACRTSPTPSAGYNVLPPGKTIKLQPRERTPHFRTSDVTRFLNGGGVKERLFSRWEMKSNRCRFWVKGGGGTLAGQLASQQGKRERGTRDPTHRRRRGPGTTWSLRESCQQTGGTICYKGYYYTPQCFIPYASPRGEIVTIDPPAQHPLNATHTHKREVARHRALRRARAGALTGTIQLLASFFPSEEPWGSAQCFLRCESEKLSTQPARNGFSGWV